MFKRLLFFIFLAPLFMYAQGNCDLELKGKVIDAENRAIPFATVEVSDGNNTKRVVSDEQGNFLIQRICNDRVGVNIRFVGFKPFNKQFRTSEGAIQVQLENVVTDLDEVTIEGEKVEEVATLQRAEISGAELDRTAGASLGEALTEISGVNMLQTGPTIAKPVIHGLHSNRILILNNGIRQEGQQWGQEHAPEIDPFVANNLRLIKGAAAVKYGSDAIGGVILVNPPELPSQAGISGKAHIVGSSNNKMYASSVLLEGGLRGVDGLGWRLQGTFKKAGDARAADYRLTNTGTEENNFSLGLGYHKENIGVEVFYSTFDAELGILRSAHIGNLTDLARAIGSERPLFIEDFSYDINNPYQAVKHQLLKANGHIDLSNLGEFSIQYGFQDNSRKEFDIRRAGRSVIPALSLDLATHTLDFDLDMTARGPWKWDVGASFMYQDNRNDPETGVRPLIPNFENWTAGAHMISRYVKTSHELEFGIRYDYKHYLVKRFDRNNNLLKPEFDFNNVTGSLGAIFFLPNNWSLRSNLGTAWRAPHVNELYSEGLHHGAAAIEEGNENLTSEKAVKWITSLEKQTSKLGLSISGYINRIGDYIYLRPEDVSLTIRGAFPTFRYRQTDALFYGMDVDLDLEVSEHIDISGQLSLIRAEDLITDGPLINIPSNRLQSAITYHFNEGKVKHPFLAISAVAVDRQRYAPRVITTDEVLTAKASDVNLFANDPTVFDLVSPPEGYINFNLSGGFKVPVRLNEKRPDRIGQLNVFFSIDNVFNNSYRDYLNRFRYYADDLGRNISLKLAYEF